MRNSGSHVVTWGARGVLVAWLSLLPGILWATPDDDYRDGKKFLDRGDLIDAMPFLKKAADAGHAPAQALYAYILDKSESDDEAVAYYKKAIAQGNADAQFGLAGMLMGAEGVPADIPEGRRLFLLAAEQGHEQATIVLSLAYMNGGLELTDAERKGPDAIKWIKRAAEFKHVPSMERLAAAYRAGEFGLTVNPAEADRLTQRVNEILDIDPNAPKKRRRKN